MAATEFTEAERRIRNLEFQMLALQNKLRSVEMLAGKAAQDVSQITPVLGGGSGQNGFFAFQVLAAGVSAASGATLGSGTVRLQTVISGKRYNKTDGTAGHYTDFAISNDSFTALVSKEYGVATLVDGIMRVIFGTCTAAAAFSADDITA